MSEYTIERIQKETEQESLGYFLEAYENLTGVTFELLEATERPDFICIRDSGGVVGVELSKVRRGHPNGIQWDQIVEKRDFMLPEDALEMIQAVGANKERKRNEADWKLPEGTMLLIELWDIPLAHIERSISPETLPDLYATGFEEIWLADFTGLEAYDNVELFCVRPDEWAGYHPRVFQKPHG
jgi:hypothetical protein